MSFCFQLEIVKGKIKSCKSKEEAESLKFTEKNLINKVGRSNWEHLCILTGMFQTSSLV